MLDENHQFPCQIPLRKFDDDKLGGVANTSEYCGAL